MTDKKTSIYGALLLPVVFLAACVSTADKDAERLGEVVAAEVALADGRYKDAMQGYFEAGTRTDNLSTVQRATELVFDFGRSEAAHKLASHWRDLAPLAAEPELYLGRLALREGDVDASFTHFSRYSNLYVVDSTATAQDRLAAVLLGEGKPEHALDLAERMAAANPESWGAYRTLFRVAMRAEQPNKALDAAEVSYSLAPESFDAALLQAQAIIIGGDRVAGMAFAREISAQAQSADDKLEYAALLSANDEAEQALKWVNDVLAEEPENAKANKALAVMKLRSGDLQGAWQGFSELVTNPKEQHDAVFYMATIAERQGRQAQAIRLYDQISPGPNTVLARQRISQILLRLGQEEEALNSLDDFARRDPEQGFRLLLPRASLYRDLGRYDEAIAIYDDILDIRPRSEGILLTRAEAYLSAGDLDEAIAGYRAALKEHPDSANSLNALGYTLADRTEQFDEAYDLIKRAYDLRPDNAAIIDSMGWIEFKLGNYEQALEHLERAWDQIKDPEVAAHLGETLWRLGEKDRARQILKEAYDRSPGSQPLRETLERLLKEQNENRVES